MQKPVAEKADVALTREDLIARAEGLIPVLAARSAECEKARSAPAATIRDFIDLGLLRVCQPARYGGYELGYDVLCEISQTLARGCGSQAWVHMVLADNPLKLSAFSLEAQDDVWGVNSAAKICVAVAAVGNDTGPMHLIAAAGCASIVLFSDDSDPALCAPRGRVTVLRRPDLASLEVSEVAAAFPSTVPAE